MAEVQLWNQRWGNLLSGDGAAATTSTTPGRTPGPSRVVASPEFTETDCPIDTTAAFQFDESDILPATSHMEFLGTIC